jgi:hypothetical protein
MKRMKRGDMSRVNMRRATHTDVYHPPPVAATRAQAPAGSGDGKVQELQTELAKVKADNKKLSNLTADSSARLDKAAEETQAAVKRAEAAEQRAEDAEAALKEVPTPAEPPAPVDSVKVQAVKQVRSKGSTMRIDCAVEPTDGPLQAEVAIYLTVEEGAKLRLEEEAKDEQPTPEATEDE